MGVTFDREAGNSHWRKTTVGHRLISTEGFSGSKTAGQ